MVLKIISGILFSVIGLGLIGGAYFIPVMVGKVSFVIYGLIALGIGVYMLVNLDEDEKIEKIKEKRKK